jgi:hypothetical protein
MKNYPIELSLISLLLFVPMLIFWIYGDKLLVRKPQSAPISAINLVLGAASNPEPTIQLTSTPTQTPAPTQTELPSSTPTPTNTRIPQPTDTPTPAIEPTNTPTFREMLKNHIVFYLIQPQKGHQDACGDIQVVPIVSRRLRTGDKVYDVQVALQMLFNMRRKIYIQWYNALWDTNLTIESYDYNAKKDYMTINFGGYLDAGQLSNCDKHGIREQVWATFFHYGIREKTFKVNGEFMIDELNRKSK